MLCPRRWKTRALDWKMSCLLEISPLKKAKHQLFLKIGVRLLYLGSTQKEGAWGSKVLRWLRSNKLSTHWKGPPCCSVRLSLDSTVAKCLVNFVSQTPCMPMQSSMARDSAALVVATSVASRKPKAGKFDMVSSPGFPCSFTSPLGNSIALAASVPFTKRSRASENSNAPRNATVRKSFSNTKAERLCALWHEPKDFLKAQSRPGLSTNLNRA